MRYEISNGNRTRMQVALEWLVQDESLMFELIDESTGLTRPDYNKHDDVRCVICAFKDMIRDRGIHWLVGEILLAFDREQVHDQMLVEVNKVILQKNVFEDKFERGVE